jgi:hypothetical protein
VDDVPVGQGRKPLVLDFAKSRDVRLFTTSRDCDWDGGNTRLVCDTDGNHAEIRIVADLTGLVGQETLTVTVTASLQGETDPDQSDNSATVRLGTGGILDIDGVIQRVEGLVSRGLAAAEEPVRTLLRHPSTSPSPSASTTSRPPAAATGTTPAPPSDKPAILKAPTAPSGPSTPATSAAAEAVRHPASTVSGAVKGAAGALPKPVASAVRPVTDAVGGLVGTADKVVGDTTSQQGDPKHQKHQKHHADHGKPAKAEHAAKKAATKAAKKAAKADRRADRKAHKAHHHRGGKHRQHGKGHHRHR